MIRRSAAFVSTAVLAAMLLAGCAGEEPPAADTSTQENSPMATTAPPVNTSSPTAPATVNTETANADPDGVPAECTEQRASAMADTGPVGAAVTGAVVAPEISLVLGTQVIGSTDDPGMEEVVVRLCSAPLNDDELISAANAIALALYLSPAGDQVSLLKVSSWTPDGAGSIEQDRSVTCDEYQLYLWDATPDLLRANWQLT